MKTFFIIVLLETQLVFRLKIDDLFNKTELKKFHAGKKYVRKRQKKTLSLNNKNRNLSGNSLLPLGACSDSLKFLHSVHKNHSLNSLFAASSPPLLYRFGKDVEC